MKYLLTCFIGEEHLLAKSLRRKLGDAVENLVTSPRGFRGLVLLETAEDVELEPLRSIPTIQQVVPIHSEQTGASLEELASLAADVAGELPEGSSFAVRATRRGDHAFTSPEVERRVGREILEQRPDLVVDLEHPQYRIDLEFVQDWTGVSCQRT